MNLATGKYGTLKKLACFGPSLNDLRVEPSFCSRLGDFSFTFFYRIFDVNLFTVIFRQFCSPLALNRLAVAYAASGVDKSSLSGGSETFLFPS